MLCLVLFSLVVLRVIFFYVETRGMGGGEGEGEVATPVTLEVMWWRKLHKTLYGLSPLLC